MVEVIKWDYACVCVCVCVWCLAPSRFRILGPLLTGISRATAANIVQFGLVWRHPAGQMSRGWDTMGPLLSVSGILAGAFLHKDSVSSAQGNLGKQQPLGVYAGTQPTLLEKERMALVRLAFISPLASQLDQVPLFSLSWEALARWRAAASLMSCSSPIRGISLSVCVGGGGAVCLHWGS